MKFKNPSNGYVEIVSGKLSWLWVFLLGPIYWLVKGVWKHALLHIILASITIGVAHLIYPFFTYSILRKHYNSIGWKIVE